MTLINNIKTRGSTSSSPKVEFITLLGTLLGLILDNLSSIEGRG